MICSFVRSEGKSDSGSFRLGSRWKACHDTRLLRQRTVKSVTCRHGTFTADRLIRWKVCSESKPSLLFAEAGNRSEPSESFVVLRTGKLSSRRPGSFFSNPVHSSLQHPKPYKMPNLEDAPRLLRITLLLVRFLCMLVEGHNTLRLMFSVT